MENTKDHLDQSGGIKAANNQGNVDGMDIPSAKSGPTVAGTAAQPAVSRSMDEVSEPDISEASVMGSDGYVVFDEIFDFGGAMLESEQPPRPRMNLAQAHQESPPPFRRPYGGGYRLGTAEDDIPAPAGPTQSEYDIQMEAQAHAENVRQARERRQMLADAAARRVSQSMGQATRSNATANMTAGSAINTSTPAGTRQTTGNTLSQSSSSTQSGITSEYSTAATTPASPATNPLSALFAERAARESAQAQQRELTRRAAEKVRMKEAEAKRKAAMTPKQLHEHRVRQEAMDEAKKTKQLREAEVKRVKAQGEAIKRERQQRFEDEAQRRRVARMEEEKKRLAREKAMEEAMREVEGEMEAEGQEEGEGDEVLEE